MALQYEINEAPAAEVASLYKQTESGSYVLDVEGVIPATKFQEVETKYKDTETKLKEFRENNIALRKELEQKSGSGVNIEALLETHVAEMKTNYSSQIQALAEQKTQLEQHLERVVLSDGVKEAAIKYGVLESALPDVLSRAKDTFTVKDGKPVPKAKLIDKEGNPMGVTNWIQSLAETAPHLFAQSRGSGAQKTIKAGSVQRERSTDDKIAAGLAGRQTK